MLRPLKIKDFALLWTGMGASLLGDGINFVALPWQVLHLDNSAGALAAVGVALTLPQLIFLLIGGVATDRLDRRRVFIFSDVVRGLAIALIGVLSLMGTLEVWHIVALVACYGIGEAFFAPAFGAIVPDIVPQHLLVEANSLDQFVRPLTLRLAGPALGGILIAATGVGVAFVVDAATFAVSAIAVFLISTRPSFGRTADGGTSAWAEIKDGVRFVRSQTWLWASLAFAAIGLLCFYGPWQVLVPFIVKNKLGGGADDYGWVMAAGGAGAVLAALFVAQRGLPRRHITVAYLAWGIGTLAMAGYAFARAPWQAMVVSFVMSTLFAAGIIIWGTLMHTLVPSDLLGRVSSVDWFFSTAFVPLSYALVGNVSAAIGVEETLIAAGLLGGLLPMSLLFVRGVHDIEKPHAGPAR